MYEDELSLRRQYKDKGYKCLGDVMFNQNASLSYQKSKDKESHRIGKNYDFVVLHDMKAFVTIDSSD